MRISDWSSDVCSSDLGPYRAGVAGRAHLVPEVAAEPHRSAARHDPEGPRAGPVFRELRGHRSAAVAAEGEAAAQRGRVLQDRKSVVSGKSVSVRVDLGCSRIIKKQYRKSP